MSAPTSPLDIPGVWRGRIDTRVESMPTGHSSLDVLLPGGGFPRAALTEILHSQPGIGELSLVLPMLARLTKAGGRVMVMAPPHIPYAPAFAQAGVSLPQMVVVQPPMLDEVPWGVEQALRSGVFALVLAWSQRASSESVLRLQRAAEAGRAIGVLMRPLAEARQHSHSALRLALRMTASGPDVEVLKVRGGRAGTHALLAA